MIRAAWSNHSANTFIPSILSFPLAAALNTAYWLFFSMTENADPGSFHTNAASKG
jgi:hypothetical protein